MDNGSDDTQHRLRTIEAAITEQKLRCATCAASLPERFDSLHGAVADVRADITSVQQAVTSMSAKLFENGLSTRIKVVETKMGLLHVVAWPVVLLVAGLVMQAAYSYFSAGKP